MVRNLAIELVRVSEFAALAASKHIGRGDEKAADQAAVDAMRKCLNSLTISGTVVIGEGERDDAPMLFIGEELGNQVGIEGALQIDIAVDPLECTNNCADNTPNSIAVLAAAPRGTLLHAPDCYMDKIAAGPELAGHISLDGGVTYNLEQAADILDKPISEVRVVALDRERHADLFKEVKEAGAQLHLMGDGDVSAAIWAARPDGPYDMLLGIGAAPEGVITATAIRGIGGVFEGRLVFRSDEEEKRAEKMVNDDLTRLWDATDLCRSDDAIFAASGVCDGYLPGVIVGDDNVKTFSELIDVQTGEVTRHDRTHTL